MSTAQSLDVHSTAPATPSGTLTLDPIDAEVDRIRGVRALSERVSQLADLAAVSLRASEPAYRSRVPTGELKLATSAGHVLAAWRRRPADRAATALWAGEVGRRRAEQGVALDALSRAYRIGGQVMFGAFLQWAAEEDIPRDRATALAGEVWPIMDLHCAAATTAFRETEDQMSCDRAAQAGRLLDVLLDGAAEPELVAEASQAGGLAERGRYVVVIRRPTARGGPLDRRDTPTTVAYIRMIWRLRGGVAIGIAPLGDAPASMIASALPVRPGRRTGVGLVVDGLAELGRARRYAELAARTITADDGVAFLPERLPAALLAAWPDLAKEMASRVLGPVLELEAASRDLLLDTLAAWLAAGGSAPRAASALFCHRNTVVNRIRRIEHLTKRSLSVPNDLVELSLASTAVELGAGRS
jgi:hypothetical protein